ncbi:MAG: DUF4178 domain-containing protein [Thiotrichaceae bacterium]
MESQIKKGSKDINCPQCGNQLPIKFRYAKLTVCAHCGSTLFLEDQSVKLAGKQAELAEMPSLLQLGASFQYRTTSFVPIGMVRYAHDIGFWEEWWVIDNSGRGSWVSVDEGDFAFEKPLEIEQSEMPTLTNLSLGKKISLWNDSWQVTEIDVGKCMGFKGELPKIAHINEKIPFVHLSGDTGQLITLEYLKHDDKQTIEAFQGEWIDPFEIKSI